MTVYFATDHAGYELKNVLLAYVHDELGYQVHDCGAHEYDVNDDYPDYIKIAAKAVSQNPDESRAIIIGASGQGEAMVANRFTGVRATLYYGDPLVNQTDASGEELNLIASMRLHNNSNVLALGARFIDGAQAKSAVASWLKTEFTADQRHVRRISKIDNE